MIAILRIFLLSVIFLIGVSNRGYTQAEKKTDKLYLNNGSILTGKVINYFYGDSIIFSINGNQHITLPETVIKKIKMGSPKDQKLYSFNQKFYCRTQISSLYGNANNGLSVSASVGYQYRNWMSIGIGTGIDNYFKTSGYNLFPMFMEIRSFILHQNTTPYIACRTGYSFAKNNIDKGQTKAEGGFFINPTFGYRLTGGKQFIDIFCGVKLQSSSYETSDNWKSSRKNYILRRYDMGAAVTF